MGFTLSETLPGTHPVPTLKPIAPKSPSSPIAPAQVEPVAPVAQVAPTAPALSSKEKLAKARAALMLRKKAKKAAEAATKAAGVSSVILQAGLNSTKFKLIQRRTLHDNPPVDDVALAVTALVDSLDVKIDEKLNKVKSTDEKIKLFSYSGDDDDVTAARYARYDDAGKVFEYEILDVESELIAELKTRYETDKRFTISLKDEDGVSVIYLMKPPTSWNVGHPSD